LCPLSELSLPLPFRILIYLIESLLMIYKLVNGGAMLFELGWFITFQNHFVNLITMSLLDYKKFIDLVGLESDEVATVRSLCESLTLKHLRDKNKLVIVQHERRYCTHSQVEYEYGILNFNSSSGNPTVRWAPFTSIIYQDTSLLSDRMQKNLQKLARGQYILTDLYHSGKSIRTNYIASQESYHAYGKTNNNKNNEMKPWFAHTLLSVQNDGSHTTCIAYATTETNDPKFALVIQHETKIPCQYGFEPAPKTYEGLEFLPFECEEQDVRFDVLMTKDYSLFVLPHPDSMPATATPSE